MSISAIVRTIERSRKVVGVFLKDPGGYATAKRTRKPCKLSERKRRVVFRQAAMKKKTTSQIATALSDAGYESVSTRTIQRELVRTGVAKYVKQKWTPRLEPEHKIARVIIFSDEKKFNLDGPYGLKYYRHDFRKEKESYWSRQNGGGFVMAWDAFSKAGKLELSLLVGRQDSFDYQQTLINYLFPFTHGYIAGDYVFQQDNASIHASNSTKAFLSDLNIPVLRWPSLSPVLNSIENLWGDMTQTVYCKGRQYEIVNELKDAILEAWTSIPQSRLDALVGAMPDRCLDVVDSQGANIDYWVEPC